MISVCIATHNGEKYIKEQLESILSQLEPDDEVIISDDGSQDNTLHIIEGHNDKRIKIYHFTQPTIAKHPHEYVCRNFENALKHAKGDYIFMADQDDIWTDDKVKVCLPFLRKYDLIVHDMQVIDYQLNKVDGGYNGSFLFHNWMQISPTYFGCVMAFRKELKDIILPFPPKLLTHDYWIGMLAEMTGKVKYINEKLIYYRIHDCNTSKNTSNTLWFKISYRIYTLFQLLIRYYKVK